METNVRYTIAGIFVLVMSALIIFSIIWLSAGITNEKYTYYSIFMKESVTGLNKDGPVEFNGVEVGTIDAMLLSKEHPELVELRLKIKSNTPISVATTAKLAFNGVLSGAAFILLEDSGKDKSPLLKKANQLYPVIPTTPSILVRLDKGINQINNDIHEVSTSFHQISSSVRSLISPENLASIKRLLQKLGG